MSNDLPRFRQGSDAEGRQRLKPGPAGTEFQSAEDLLRHDAATVEVPPAVAERLKESLAREPAARRSWWNRFFKSGS